MIQTMLQFMKRKIIIPTAILCLFAAIFSFRYAFPSDETLREDKKKNILFAVMAGIQRTHFSPKEINDSLSSQVYYKVLTNLDYDKKFFTQGDINRLKKYQFDIDDQIKAGSTEFFDTLNEIFSKRIDSAQVYYKEILSQPFSFDVNDSIELNGELLSYTADESELRKRWEVYLKYRVLSRYVDSKNNQEKDTTKNAEKKSDAVLEKEAREGVLKNQDMFFKRLRKIKDKDRYTIYINSITNVMDPHTDFLPPKEKAMFDENMSGSFYGIGAQLQESEGKIKIVAIITGSPCWKQGELKAGDEILKVAQGDANPVDIQGYDIDDVVNMIRGNKGTEVRLTVKKVDGSIRVIPIIRGEVKREEVFARSAIIKNKSGNIGYIYLPEFYADFNHISNRRCAEDVAIEVMKLKNAGVSGIILDLRNNGGGSLQDVIDMAGLFIDKGPIVQVKTSGSAPEQMNDRRGGTLYDGPLAILVNQSSASASEIMAAAMQDYNRAIVVGSTTFGKGTVQRFVSLDDLMRYQNIKISDTLGALKVTVQKFYRINGGSTQLKGVTPDVVLPDIYQEIAIGERRDKFAMPWDEIAPASYTPIANQVDFSKLAKLSEKRVKANPTFQLIAQSALDLKKKEHSNVYPLKEDAYKKALEDATANSKRMEELDKKAVLLSIENLKEDMPRIEMDSVSIAKNEEWLKALKKDIYISETVNILDDWNGMLPKLNTKNAKK